LIIGVADRHHIRERAIDPKSNQLMYSYSGDVVEEVSVGEAVTTTRGESLALDRGRLRS
jgi:hypothetical protein